MQVSKLPPSWRMISIGEFCSLINGRAFKSTEWTDKGLPIIRIQNLNNPNANFNFFNGNLDSKHRVETGDLLFAWSGTPGSSFGAHVWGGNVGALNQHIFKVVFNEYLIEKRFIRYAINQTLDELISGAHGGVGLRHITKGKFEATEIAFPSLAEQKAIADQLDILLTQIEASKARLEHITETLKTFRHSVLSAAVSGKLTENWRENKKINWIKSTLANICRSVSDGDHQAPPKADFGIPFLVISNISKGEIDYSSVNRWVPESYYESLKDIRKPEINDILYTVTGSFGIPVIVKTTAPFCFQRHIAIIKPNHSSIDYKYLFYYLASPEVFKHAKSIATGTAQKTVSLSHLRNFNILLPPIEEQAEIVHRVEELLAFADSIEQKSNAALARVDDLTQSILVKAFTGELTADWRAANPELISSDNSAESLLKKIKADREVIERQPKLKRTTVKKKTSSHMSKQTIKVAEALKQAEKPLSGQQLLIAAGYPSDSSTEQLEQFFLDIRNALAIEKSIVKLERDSDSQDWFTLAKDNQK